MLYMIKADSNNNSYMTLKTVNIEQLLEQSEIIKINTPYEMVDFMEKKVINGHAFNYDIIRMVKSTLQHIRQNDTRTYDDYTNISYYLDKLRWISGINIENYNNERCQIEIDLMRKRENLGFGPKMLEVNIKEYIGTIKEFYKEQINDMFDDQISSLYQATIKNYVDDNLVKPESIPPITNIKNRRKAK